MRTPRPRPWSLRFRPLVAPSGGGAVVLDRRLLPSVDMGHLAAPGHPPGPALARPAARVERIPGSSGRVTPAQEINKAYAQFLADFRTVEVSYVQTFSQQSSGTVNASTILTAPYQAGSVTMQVQDGAVFGQPSTTAPVTVTAVVDGASVGNFSVIGSSATQLVINPAQSSLVTLGANTTLTGQVNVSGSNSAGTIFPSYIDARTQLLAVQLVNYFNSLPFKLPRMFAFPHQARRTGALQQYVYQLVAGATSTSLQQLLGAVALPQTSGGDLQIYDASITTIVNASRLQMLSGVQQIFSGKLQVVPTNLTGTSGTTASSGTTSSTGTSGTGTPAA